MKKIIASLLVVLIISLGYCSSTEETATPMPEEPAKTEPAKDAKTPAKAPAKAPAKK